METTQCHFGCVPDMKENPLWTNTAETSFRTVAVTAAQAELLVMAELPELWYLSESKEAQQLTC